MSEPRYTLAEARALLKKEECRLNGHDYDVQTNLMTGMPVGIRCNNCGDFWRVFHPVDSPTVSVRTIEAKTEVMPRLR